MFIRRLSAARFLSVVIAEIVTIATFLLVMPSTASALPAGFSQTQVIGSGLDAASGFEFAPDGRIFILERTGAVKIFKNGELLPTPFYTFPSVAEGDRGLIGIAFDPNFTANHFVYFYYTGQDLFNHVVRFDATEDVATGGPTSIFQTQVPSNQLHVGGTVRFGNDGKLYFAIGDNGYPPNAQDLGVPFGKILRLNADGTVPSDNPFVGQAGKMPEIWAYGLRNPWRFQFDSATGRLYDGDVGNNTWEEINLIVKGGNYGWPLEEGNCTTTCATTISPIYAYNHNGQSNSVTGGPVYHGSQFPSQYQGHYFFGDYAAGFIKDATLNSDGTISAVNDFVPQAGSVVDMKIAPDGSMYYVTYWPARMYKVSFAGGNQVPVAIAGSNKTKGIEPLTVDFTSYGSYDPDGTSLGYSWDFGDGTTSSSPDPVKTYPNKGTYTVTLTVTDGVNSNQAVPIVIQVGLAPTVTIGAPADGSHYNAGDTINYTAFGKDGGGFDINDAHIVTDVIFHHHTHVHPFVDGIVGRTGSFTLPSTGEAAEDTWYEIKTTVTDTNGLSTSASVLIYPNKADITLASNPPGIPIGLDGSPQTTPYTFTGVTGFQRELTAPTNYTVGGQTYVFDHWSDAGGIKHTIVTPGANTTFTAEYVVGSQTAEASSFEQLNGEGQPVGIQSSSWGQNNAAITMSNDAYEGFRSGRIEMSNYVNGDARWYLSPISVTGGHTYTYRAWYKGTQPTKVVADITLSDNSHSYQWIGIKDPAADWTLLTADLVMPANATKVTVNQYLGGNGWLQVDAMGLRDHDSTPPPPPPPPTSNLIANPSVETLAPDTQLPVDWTRGSWGDNTVDLSVGAARTGAHGLHTQLSNRVSGDAKWISPPTPVTGGTTYRFSNWYRSDISSFLTLDITLADGSHSYQWLGQQDPSADWKQTDASITVPANATSVRVQQYINENGFLDTDDYSLSPM